jgi:hypothetical protein
MTSNQKVIIPADVKEAIASARKATVASYVVVSYSNVNTLNVVGAGEGGYEEVSSFPRLHQNCDVIAPFAAPSPCVCRPASFFRTLSVPTCSSERSAVCIGFNF